MDPVEKAPVKDKAPSQPRDHVLEEKKEEGLIRERAKPPYQGEVKRLQKQTGAPPE